MKKNLIFGAGQGVRLAVLEQIKRSAHGQSVQEIAAALGMSYMGVKSHCLTLTASGYLAPWRQPSGEKSRGRPKLLYRLTGSGERFFADSGDELALSLLQESAGLFGASAPQKLLVMLFRSSQARYAELVGTGDLKGRLRRLIRLRDREGRMSELVESESWEIHENHNPLASIMRRYPEACSLEEHMMSEILGVGVKRKEEGMRVIFAPERSEGKS
jgi:predicted ArsR family transcriptional regulator